MKTLSQHFSTLATVLLSITWGWTAEFRNLDFEEALVDPARMNLFPQLTGISPGAGAGRALDLIPGWNLSFGSEPTDGLGFNYPGFFFGTIYATLFDGNYLESPLLEGRYSLLFRVEGPVGPYRITQAGTVPVDARYLTFTFGGNGLVASINGEDITSLYPIPAFNPKTVVADISRFAGQTVELTFRTTDEVPVLGGGPVSILDSIAFSVIPEPSTYALLALGGGAFGGLWLQRRRRRSLSH